MANPTPIPAIGTISDPTKVRVALMQGNQAVNGPPLSVVADAVGVPSGGTTGQVLTKSSDADYDNEWADVPTQGDLSGPASAVDGNFAAFDGTTGKLVKDSGKKASDFQTALGYTPANKAGDTFTGQLKMTNGVEIVTGLGNVFRMKSTGVAGSTGYGVFWRIDANNTYLMRTALDDPDGSWSTPFIFTINHSTKLITVAGDPTSSLGIATKQYVDALPLAKSYESAQQTITSGGLLTLAHGLGARPKVIQTTIKCQTAENGYSVGDEVNVEPINNCSDGTSRANSVTADATNIYYRFSSTATCYLGANKTTGATVAFTNANWKLIVRAWL